MKQCQKYGCGSFAFNLKKDGIDQGNFCDVCFLKEENKFIRKTFLTLLKSYLGAFKINNKFFEKINPYAGQEDLLKNIIDMNNHFIEKTEKKYELIKLNKHLTKIANWKLK